jgi:hypothetical protein
MRKTVSIVLAIMIFSSFAPANAILGLSACEKAKKSIKTEEAIGLAIWKEFDMERDRLVRNNNVRVYEYIYILRQQTSVYNSDLIIFKIANKNAKCFSPKIIGKIRQSEVSTRASLKDIGAAIRQFDTYSVSMRSQSTGSYAMEYLKSTYLSFVSIYSWKN